MNHRHERVVIETDRHRIEGTLTLPAEGYRSRVSDLFNATDAGPFVSLRDAVVEPLDGTGATWHHGYLAVSRAHVVLFAPVEAKLDRAPSVEVRSPSATPSTAPGRELPLRLPGTA